MPRVHSFPLRGRALRSLLLAALATACASEPAPFLARHLRSESCTPDQRQGIARAFGGALNLADATRAAVEDEKKRQRMRADDWSPYLWWFGEYDALRFEVVEHILRATREQFDDGFRMHCGGAAPNCPAPQPPRGGGRRRSEDPDEYGPEYEGDRDPRSAWKEFAYSNHGVSEVQLCAAFFREKRDAQAAILFHEMTHIAGDTEDYAYREEDVLELATQNPARAVVNAASYAAFAESVAFGKGVRVAPRRTEGGS